jgi:hypothetical protein
MCGKVFFSWMGKFSKVEILVSFHCEHRSGIEADHEISAIQIRWKLFLMLQVITCEVIRRKFDVVMTE